MRPSLTTATAASAADTVAIDAVDSGGVSAWQPPNVSIAPGDTVRWEFDQAAVSHTITSSSPNWSVDETRAPGGAAVERTFASAGTYTFLCKFHSAMTGTVTVEDDPLQKVLVFSTTAGFRHDSIPAGITAIQELGAANGFAVDATEDGAQFTDANLAQYDAVIWLSTTGDVLTDEQQAAFERYIRAGNGYVGIHAAADTEYGWDWYGDLVGGYFASHPAGTPTAAVDVEDTAHPSTATVPTRWTRTDEWYNYKPPAAGAASGADYSPRYDVHVLATVDESTYGEGDGSDGVDDDHPIAWCSNFDGGKSWYTGMGHTIGSFGEADFREHLLGGIESVTGAAASDCGAERVPRPARPTSRRSRSTTTPRIRSSSTSPPTGASSTSSATGA